MSINEPIQEVTLRLKREVTSRNTKLMRTVSQDQETGFYTAQYPIEIDIEAITYELDAQDNKTGIYDHQFLGNVSLTAEEIGALWATQLTLDDGTVTVLGLLLADRIDQIIAAKLAGG